MPTFRVEAVRSDWTTQVPPQEGWVEVSLPDDWSRRWPQFDGVVWYRLTWKAAAPLADTGLFVDYLIMAATITVNGGEIARDASLVEPVSRMWNTPRYFLLPAQWLHEGDNVLLLRVSGLAAYEPGLGPVYIGDPETIRPLYEHATWIRQTLPLVYLAIGATLGSFFLALWAMRRRNSAYGWYAAMQLLWVAYQSNLVVHSLWPFSNTDHYKNAIHIVFYVFNACNLMFVLRFCERYWPRREMALWAVTALLILATVAAPHTAMRQVENLSLLYGLFMGTLATVLFVFLAWRRGGRFDQRILAAVGFVSLCASYRDALVVLRVIPVNTYYATYFEQLDVIAVAVVLAWNFVRNQSRIERFNIDLQRNVEEAREELTSSLHRQHELELVHVRLGERVNLAHDLHDGLGGMLIGNITALEQTQRQMPSSQVLDLLRGLRDDLRLIIDTASAQQYGELSMAQLLAPMRHRVTRLFDAHGIELDWDVTGLEKLHLTTAQSLDVLRITQEALTNVLKHSDATHVTVEMEYADDALRMEVSDNGVGMPATPANTFGTGMRSMQQRARRLNAAFSIGSEPGSTVVRLNMPRPSA